jgi:hypothetical protein
MRPSFIGSSPFQEESFSDYTTGNPHFPEDFREGNPELLELLLFLNYKIQLEETRFAELRR